MYILEILHNFVFFFIYCQAAFGTVNDESMMMIMIRIILMYKDFSGHSFRAEVNCLYTNIHGCGDSVSGVCHCAVKQ